VVWDSDFQARLLMEVYFFYVNTEKTVFVNEGDVLLCAFKFKACLNLLNDENY